MMQSLTFHAASLGLFHVSCIKKSLLELLSPQKINRKENRNIKDSISIEILKLSFQSLFFGVLKIRLLRL